MRGLKRLLSDKITLAGFSVALLLLAGLLVALLLRADFAAESAPLHYNIYFGIDLVGSGRALVWPWLIALLTTLANLTLATVAAERDRLVGRLLAWFSVAVAVLATTASLLVLWYRP